jgi:hypothetical protein
MNRIERLDRIKVFGRIALGFARRNDYGYFVDYPHARYRTYDVAHNGVAVDHLQSINESIPSRLIIRYLGKKVFEIEWINGGPLTKTSFKPGEWEAMLIRFAALPIYSKQKRVPLSV